jgi:DNA-binding NarL/FixJ family response regulator
MTTQSRLSPREVVIMSLVARGFTNSAIASTLNLSIPTVKNNMYSILRKLNAGNRTQAVYKMSQPGGAPDGN